ncbi:vWA domain-containing protein [Ferdinandcohnia quinoae]|uniref:VWA domain-containing protein n=1 Tax=Fredinandcohnia quinoae TaxID=2918902 RepID=A0AAW5E7L6_9BACI|nr:vWA domain-containing protein [Fredinandcohnia sp. SECRCQ15]MCH1626001.1 VWA domain-containing protein [Fredinandcohnia sp. SECRCQ15]
MSKINQIVKRLLIPFIIIALSISPIGASNIFASVPPEAEVVFVIDTSFSMKTNDKERITNEVLNMFIDLNEDSKTKVGFVFYNDKIVASQPLTSLESLTNKSRLKEKLNTIPQTGYTDLGLGLKNGQELLVSSNHDQTSKTIILLTDGEIDLPPHSERTKAESESDITEVIKKAQQENHTIHTVGLSSGGIMNEKQLKHIAVETGGSTFFAQKAEALPEIFQTIFAGLGQSTIFPIASVTANGKEQEVKIDIPFGISEGSVVLLSQQPIGEAIIYGDTTVSKQHQSKHYTILNMKQIKEQSLFLNFKAVSGDMVTVSFLGNQPFTAALELPEEKIVKDEPIVIRSKLISKDTSTPSELSSSLVGELVVKHLITGTELRFPMKNTGAYFELEQEFTTLGNYEAKALITGPSFQAETESMSFELINSQPILSKSEPITKKKSNPIYLIVGIAAFFICIALITLWLTRRSYSFIGRLEGVYRQTEGKMIPSKKHWPLAAFNNQKQVTLSELFSRLDIHDKVPGAEQIYFQAGKNGVLFMKHTTRCIILKGGTTIPRNQKVIIRNNEKLFITFEDGEMEVELLYKATEQYETIEAYSYTS